MAGRGSRGRYQDLTGRNAYYVEVYELEEQKPKARSEDEDFIDDVKALVRGAAGTLRSGTLAAAVVGAPG